jgi:hypothetical protein
MTLAQIIERKRGRAGSNGAWRVERDDSDPFVGNEYSLWHYGTRMLRWRETSRYGREIMSVSLGHGSVSDQGGMNTAFKVLGASWYFSRKGGAEIRDYETGDVIA